MSESLAPRPGDRPESIHARTGGNESTGWIKVLAIACMVVDHVGAVFFPGVWEWRVIGRIAFPLFAWCLCVGAEYTRNIWIYALRLFLVGLISQPCFNLALNHTWQDLNIYATLLTGLLGIAAIRTNRFGSAVWGPIAALGVSCLVRMDYGWQGVAFILLLYASRKQRASIAALMIAFCLYWGRGTVSLSQAFGIPVLRNIPFLPQADGLLADVSRLQFWAVLALPVMLVPMRAKLRLPQWVGYAAYPVHLLVIAAVRHWDRISVFLSRWL